MVGRAWPRSGRRHAKYFQADNGIPGHHELRGALGIRDSASVRGSFAGGLKLDAVADDVARLETRFKAGAWKGGRGRARFLRPCLWRVARLRLSRARLGYLGRRALGLVRCLRVSRAP